MTRRCAHGVGRVGLGLVVALLAGCSSAAVKIAPRPPATPALLGVTHGSACGVLVFNVIPVGVNDRVEKAHQEAQLANGMRSVTDVKVTERWYLVPLFGTVLCTDIEETAIQ